jgi:hypothetical protein
MEIFIVVGLLIIGFFIGWNVRERVAIITANRLLAELEHIEEETSEEVIRITIEKDRDTLFAYHKDNSQFIAQAKNRAELEKKLAELFPGKRFGVTPQNLNEIGFI